MKPALLIAFCCSCFFCLAQRVIDVDKNEGIPSSLFYSIGGEPVMNAKFIRLTSGSPFFKDEWMKASGTSSTNIVYKSGVVKLNLLDNTIYFLDKEGNERVATIPLKEILLTDTITSSTYRFVHFSSLPATAQKNWHLLLVSGKASLYQVFQKQLSENKPYGSATTEQSINTKEVFFVLLDGQLTAVKKPKDLIALLSDKQTELTKYLDNNAIKGNNTAGQLRALITYYNSLF